MIRRYLPNYKYNPNTPDSEYTRKPFFGEGTIRVLDGRNNVYGYNIDLNTTDFYINYLEYLDHFKNDWKTFGYLDLGYVPLAMAPWGLMAPIRLYALELCKMYSIEHITCKPVKFLQGGYMMTDEEDIWVKREDLIRTSGYTRNPMAFSIINFLKKEEVRDVWKQSRPR